VVTQRGQTGKIVKLSWIDNPDKSWREYGEQDPYFGVLTEDRFRKSNLTTEALKDFFASGEAHVAAILKTLHDHVGSSFQMNDALDFGCGVGRIVIPFASRFANVTGIDISESYRVEAHKNCKDRGIDNVQFLETLSPLLEANVRFDLVHSSIVFNHIPWARGQGIIAQMFELLRPGGAMAVQVMVGGGASTVRRAGKWLRRNFLPANWLMNIIRGRSAFEPLMQGNPYPLEELLPLLKAAGAGIFCIKLDTTAEGEVFATLFCTKMPA
jgi:2-polyprenyl-3-methyl-5-hydroxy-6-metoxy-1,4-benzoquinol methylase